MHEIHSHNLTTISDRLRLGKYGSGFRSPGGRLNPSSTRIGAETVNDDDLIALKYNDTLASIQIAPSGGFTSEITGLTTQERLRNRKRATNREEVETDFVRKSGYLDEIITGLKTFGADIRTISNGFGIGMYIPTVLVNQSTPGTQGLVGIVSDPTGIPFVAVNDIVIYNNGKWVKIASNDGIIVIPNGPGLRLGNLLNGVMYYRINGQLVEILGPSARFKSIDIVWNNILTESDVVIIPAGYLVRDISVETFIPFTAANDATVVLKVYDGTTTVENVTIPGYHFIADFVLQFILNHTFSNDGRITIQLINNSGATPVTSGQITLRTTYQGSI
jgi:hypothetical protein